MSPPGVPSCPFVCLPLPRIVCPSCPVVMVNRTPDNSCCESNYYFPLHGRVIVMITGTVFFPLRLPTVHPFVHRACCPSAHQQQWQQQLRGLADYYTILVLFVYHHHYPRHHHPRRCLWIAKGMRTGLNIHTKGDGTTTTGGQWNNNEEEGGRQGRPNNIHLRNKSNNSIKLSVPMDKRKKWTAELTRASS